MLLNAIFDPFIANRPISVMARGVLENLLDPQGLDALFERTAQKQYQRTLLFSTLTELMADVTFKIQPSELAAYQSRQGLLPVLVTSIYNKLNGVELGVSAELVRNSARQAAEVIDALEGRLEPWLPGYCCRVLDGNHHSATEHRLEELRTIWDAPLPGKALVVLDQERKLASNVFLTEDGHAQERSLLDEVIATVLARDVWIADRNFCTLKFLVSIANRSGYFVIREHKTLPSQLQGKRRRIGQSDTGVVYEQKMRITDPASGKQLTIRRITVELITPTRDGETMLHLLSNVPVEDADALKLSELYRKRWTIETAFQEITATLGCEISTLGYPKAALFAFCLALLAYNAVAVVKGSLRAVHGARKVEEDISSYYLGLEISQAADGMAIAIPDKYWMPFQNLPAVDMANWLKEMAGRVNLARYQKHRRGPKKKQPERQKYHNGGHASTAKLIAARRTAQPSP